MRPINKHFINPALADIVIVCEAYIPGGDAAYSSTIVAQKGSHRYLVSNTNGVGLCELVDVITGPGQMVITAYPFEGGSKSIAKLTNHRVVTTDGSEYVWKMLGATQAGECGISNND